MSAIHGAAVAVVHDPSDPQSVDISLGSAVVVNHGTPSPGGSSWGTLAGVTVQIRRATEDDLDALIELRREVAGEGIWIGAEVPLDEEGDRRTHLETIRGMPAGEPVLVLVAEVEDGPVAGYLTLRAPIGVAGLGMNIAAGHRGQGIGGALLDEGIAWARRAGAHKIELEHWPWNHAARRLYERFGFAEEGYRRRQYRRKDGSLWDSVLMGLVLDEDAPGHAERADHPPSSAAPTD